MATIQVGTKTSLTKTTLIKKSLSIETFGLKNSVCIPTTTYIML